MLGRVLTGRPPLRARRRAAACLLASMSLGCSREPPAQGLEASPAAAEPDLALASATAFDLAASATGAVLAWAGPGRSALSVARFGADGQLVGEPMQRAAFQPSSRLVFDFALSPSEAGFALLWLEENPEGTRARAVWLDGAEPALDLGPGKGASTARGNVALTSRAAGVMAAVHGGPAPCAERADHACDELRFYRLERSGALSAGITLSVPDPCDAHAVQLLSTPVATGQGSEPRVDYAVCSKAARASGLTVFGIQPERQYAAAEHVFPGCRPLGAGRFAGAGAFVADCGANRSLAAVSPGDAPLRTQTINERGLVCSGEGPRLKLGRGWLRLAEPIGALQLVLDGDLAPAGARAVWTGAALLVASVDAGRLKLARYVCAGSQLRELANPVAGD